MAAKDAASKWRQGKKLEGAFICYSQLEMLGAYNGRRAAVIVENYVDALSRGNVAAVVWQSQLNLVFT